MKNNVEKLSVEGKTLFDFCDDKEVLDFITGGLTKEEYLRESANDRERILHDLYYELNYITEDERFFCIFTKGIFSLD